MPSPLLPDFTSCLLPRMRSERRIVLNVNAFGRVQPVFLIPHTGRAPESFDMAEANADVWSGMMVEFLDQVLAYAGGKK